MSSVTKLFAKQALLPQGWANNVTVELDEAGKIQTVTANCPAAPKDAEQIQGVLLPGIANCHSHAFQRIMVGLTEKRGKGDDSFWTWRDTMYRSLEKIGPEELQAISEQLYLEMLLHGYTGVAEFHYLHHAQDGRPYSNPAEMSHRVIAAAQNVGLHITHLPVLYCHSDFGAQPPQTGQRRFVHALDDYQSLLQTLHQHYSTEQNVHLGIAPHSLRAVSEPLLDEAIRSLNRLDPNAPIHIHIAEQMREVDASLAYHGARPVAWLLDHFAVDKRWCLIHATHLNGDECRDLAHSGAIAGLCPTTEANLGDGIFAATDYCKHGGRFAIGSDSQVTLNPAEELRLLEYGQRLIHQKRSLLAAGSDSSVGEYLFRHALAGGAQALGIDTGAIRAGARADFLVLNDQHPSLYGKQGANLLDSWIFAGHGNPVKDVMVAGQWRVRDGQHPQNEQIASRFRQVLDKLF